MGLHPLVRAGLIVMAGGIVLLAVTGCMRTKKEKTGDEQMCTLTFDSFDGGGPSFSVTVEDESVVAYTSERQYDKPNHAKLDGAGYKEIVSFKGLQPGGTTVTIVSESPIMPTETTIYRAEVDAALRVTLTQQEALTADNPMQLVPTFVLSAQDRTVYPSLSDTAAADAFVSQLSREEITVVLRREAIGSSGTLPWSLGQAEEEMTATRGEILLRDDDQIVLCTETQSGVFTCLAVLDEDALANLLRSLDKDGSVSLCVEWSE